MLYERRHVCMKTFRSRNVARWLIVYIWIERWNADKFHDAQFAVILTTKNKRNTKEEETGGGLVSLTITIFAYSIISINIVQRLNFVNSENRPSCTKYKNKGNNAFCKSWKCRSRRRGSWLVPTISRFARRNSGALTDLAIFNPLFPTCEHAARNIHRASV